MDHTVKQRAFGDYSMSGSVKVTRRCPNCLNDPEQVFTCALCGGTGAGHVEYQDVPEVGIEMYDLGGGILSPTYPDGFAPGDPTRSTLSRWARIGKWFSGYGWDKGAIVWTDKGQEKNVDVIDPATRAAQVTTYYGAWGSGVTAPAVTQTALVTENAEARVATTISQPAVNTIQWLWEVTATGNRVVNEAGVFTASTVGDMWIRLTLSTLNIETGDRVEFTVQLAFKDISE